MKNKTPGALFSPLPRPLPPPSTLSPNQTWLIGSQVAQGPAAVRWLSCEKKSHGEVLRVCMGTFTTALRYNKDTVKFSTKILHLTSTLHRLLSDRLLC